MKKIKKEHTEQKRRNLSIINETSIDTLPGLLFLFFFLPSSSRFVVSLAPTNN